MILIIIMTLGLAIANRPKENTFKTPWDCDSPKGKCDLSTCVSLSMCPELIKAVENLTIDSYPEEIPEKYFCSLHGNGRPCVCCPVPVERGSNSDLPLNHEYISKKHLLPPSFQCCDRSTPLVYGGEPIKHGEFPSLALLHYVNSNGESNFPCAGTLISHRYVLTAAHCVTGKILAKSGKLEKIRLGEHDLSNTICADGKCNNGVEEYGIEKVIIHEDYNNEQEFNDITLIRLSKPLIKFPNHISPMCLRWIHNAPSSKIDPNHKFIVVGWGRTLHSQRSPIGNKLYLPHYDHAECANRFREYKRNITEKQICAGGEYKLDTCDGDSGGPLISKIKDCNYLDGIVSFGKACGLENWPGVYTNVTAYSDWIMQHIEP